MRWFWWIAISAIVFLCIYPIARGEETVAKKVTKGVSAHPVESKPVVKTGKGGMLILLPEDYEKTCPVTHEDGTPFYESYEQYMKTYVRKYYADNTMAVLRRAHNEYGRSVAVRHSQKPLTPTELERQTRILKTDWALINGQSMNWVLHIAAPPEVRNKQDAPEKPKLPIPPDPVPWTDPDDE